MKNLSSFIKKSMMITLLASTSTLLHAMEHDRFERKNITQSTKNQTNNFPHITVEDMNQKLASDEDIRAFCLSAIKIEETENILKKYEIVFNRFKNDQESLNGIEQIMPFFKELTEINDLSDSQDAHQKIISSPQYRNFKNIKEKVEELKALEKSWLNFTILNKNKTKSIHYVQNMSFFKKEAIRIVYNILSPHLLISESNRHLSHHHLRQKNSIIKIYSTFRDSKYKDIIKNDNSKIIIPEDFDENIAENVDKLKQNPITSFLKSFTPGLFSKANYYGIFAMEHTAGVITPFVNDDLNFASVLKKVALIYKKTSEGIAYAYDKAPLANQYEIQTLLSCYECSSSTQDVVLVKNYKIIAESGIILSNGVNELTPFVIHGYIGENDLTPFSRYEYIVLAQNNPLIKDFRALLNLPHYENNLPEELNGKTFFINTPVTSIDQKIIDLLLLEQQLEKQQHQQTKLLQSLDQLDKIVSKEEVDEKALGQDDIIEAVDVLDTETINIEQQLTQTVQIIDDLQQSINHLTTDIEQDLQLQILREQEQVRQAVETNKVKGKTATKKKNKGNKKFSHHNNLTDSKFETEKSPAKATKSVEIQKSIANMLVELKAKSVIKYSKFLQMIGAITENMDVKERTVGSHTLWSTDHGTALSVRPHGNKKGEIYTSYAIETLRQLGKIIQSPINEK